MSVPAIILAAIVIVAFMAIIIIALMMMLSTAPSHSQGSVAKPLTDKLNGYGFSDDPPPGARVKNSKSGFVNGPDGDSLYVKNTYDGYAPIKDGAVIATHRRPCKSPREIVCLEAEDEEEEEEGPITVIVPSRKLARAKAPVRKLVSVKPTPTPAPPVVKPASPKTITVVYAPSSGSPKRPQRRII